MSYETKGGIVIIGTFLLILGIGGVYAWIMYLVGKSQE